MIYSVVVIWNEATECVIDTRLYVFDTGERIAASGWMVVGSLFLVVEGA